MRYSNLEILKELKRIKKCIKENNNDMELVGNCIYE